MNFPRISKSPLAKYFISASAGVTLITTGVGGLSNMTHSLWRSLLQSVQNASSSSENTKLQWKSITERETEQEDRDTKFLSGDPKHHIFFLTNSLAESHYLVSHRPQCDAGRISTEMVLRSSHKNVESVRNNTRRIHIPKLSYPCQVPPLAAHYCVLKQAHLKPQPSLRYQPAKLSVGSLLQASETLAQIIPPQWIRGRFRNSLAHLRQGLNKTTSTYSKTSNEKCTTPIPLLVLQNGRETTHCRHKSPELSTGNGSANLKFRPKHVDGCRVHNTQVHCGLLGKSLNYKKTKILAKILDVRIKLVAWNTLANEL